MRSTNEIVIAVKESQAVDETELRYCVLALSAMEHFARHALDELVDAVLAKRKKADWLAAFSHNEREHKFQSKKMPVDEYLGPGNIPGNPEYEQRMKMSKAIFKKATGLEL